MSKSVDVATVRTRVDSNSAPLLVDVRTPAEFESSHIPGAINLPLQRVDAHLERIVTDAGGRLVLVCRSGHRARQCQEKLAAAGLADTVVMDGGMNAWEAQSAPVVGGRARGSRGRRDRQLTGKAWPLRDHSLREVVVRSPGRDTYGAGVLGLGRCGHVAAPWNASQYSSSTNAS
jgi:rhodanese-related sulfurtransferase